MGDEETTETQEVDLQGLVGGILDERGFTAERGERLDLLDGMESRLLEAFKSSGGGNPAQPQSAATFDEAGFIAKVEALIDGKLSSGNGGNSGGETHSKKSAGWLGRWLGLE